MKTIIFSSAMALLLSACQKETLHFSLLRNLSQQYGKITECELNGQTVYKGQLNAQDAPEMVYNTNGALVCVCDWSWGNPEPICFDILKCKVIFCVKDNIWGQPEVDIYGLE
jgi:hypothetical protein